MEKRKNQGQEWEDEEVIDLGGLPWRGAHIGKVFPPRQTIDHGGFPHVRAAREGKLRPAVPQEIPAPRGGAQKLHLGKIQCHHEPLTGAIRRRRSPGR